MQSIVPPAKKFKQALLSFSPNGQSSLMVDNSSEKCSDPEYDKSRDTTGDRTSEASVSATGRSDDGVLSTSGKLTDRRARSHSDDVMEIDVENKENNGDRDGGRDISNPVSAISYSSDTIASDSLPPNLLSSCRKFQRDDAHCLENSFAGFRQSDLNHVKDIKSRKKRLSSYLDEDSSCLGDENDLTVSTDGSDTADCSNEGQCLSNQTLSNVSASDVSIDLPDAESSPAPVQTQRRSLSGLRTEHKRLTKQEKTKQIEESKEAMRLERQRFREIARQKKMIKKQQMLEMRREIQRKKEEEKMEKMRLKEVEKQARDKEREDKRRKKDEEKQIKEQAKMVKDEERRLKEEEKRREEDEKVRKMEKARSLFSSFFAKAQTTECSSETAVNNIGASTFMQFRVKEDMAVAPILRRRLDEQQLETLDQLLTAEEPVQPSALYLQQLQANTLIPRSDASTLPRAGRQAELMDDDDGEGSICEVDTAGIPVYCRTSGSCNGCRGPRYKLLQFWENRRPSYWGTWRRRSQAVAARRPFGREQCLSYEDDSDDDWEAEDPDGESLGGSEKEIESEDDYEVDNDFFVPHGYLSDEEVKDDEEMMSPDTQKALLKAKGEEFEKQMKKKTRALKPRSIGCIWNGLSRDSVYEHLLKMLSQFSIVPFAPLPLDIYGEESSCEDNLSPAPPNEADSSRSSKFCKEFPTEGLRHLAHLLHGSVRNKKSLIREFSTFWNQRSSRVSLSGPIAEDSSDKLCHENYSPVSELNVPSASSRSAVLSDRLIDKKLTEIASYSRCTDEGPLLNRCCWLVNPNVIKDLVLNLPLPNQWTWVTSSVKNPRNDDPVGSERSSPKQSQNRLENVRKRRLITTYTKILSPKERQEDSSSFEPDPDQSVKCLDSTPVNFSKGDSSSCSSNRETKMEDYDGLTRKDVTAVNESNFKITNFFRRVGETSKSQDDFIDLTEEVSIVDNI